MRNELISENRQKLKEISTASVTTALFKRGLRNTYMQGPQRINPDAPRLVGEAYTLRYIPSREDLDTIDVFENRTHPQRQGVEEIPEGHVMVIDARGDRSAASAGGILLSRMMVRGVAGVVTDGGFRDSGEIAKMNFSAYHVGPSAPTNLIKHRAIALNDPIACGGVGIYPGDIIMGDADGVVCIPAHLANEIAEEVFEMTAFEDFVQERVLVGQSTFGLYPPTDPKTKIGFAKWRKSNNR